MTEYEYIKKQDIEAMADTITEIVVTHIFQVAIQGIRADYEFYRSEVRKSLESEDFVSDESRGWRIHPKGYGEYVLGLLIEKAKANGVIEETKESEIAE